MCAVFLIIFAGSAARVGSYGYIRCFSPEYDNPQGVQDVERMFTSRGCEVSNSLVTYPAGASMVVRAIKRVG